MYMVLIDTLNVDITSAQTALSTDYAAHQ